MSASPGHHHQPSEGLRTAFLLNSLFVLIELVGGWLTNSLAIMGDALHDFGDSASIGMALLFARLAERPQDDQFTYGYSRMEMLGAFVNGAILVGGSLVVIVTAIGRLGAPPAVHSLGMLGLAVLGVGINGLAVWRLNRADNHTMGSRVISLHLFEDVLGWAAVLLGSILIWFTGWYIIDPILSILVGLYIAAHAAELLYGTVRMFLQAAPGAIDVSDLRTRLSEYPSVQDVHALRVWSLVDGHHVISVHLVIADTEHGRASFTEVKQEIQQVLHEAGATELTVQWEAEADFCPLRRHSG